MSKAWFYIHIELSSEKMAKYGKIFLPAIQLVVTVKMSRTETCSHQSGQSHAYALYGFPKKEAKNHMQINSLWTYDPIFLELLLL